MSQNVFLDTCVFIAYSTEFEEFYSACVTFFQQTECKKYTSENVRDELNRKLERRNELYQDYSKYLARGGNEGYKVSSDINMNKNDFRHLKQLIKQLSDIPAHKKITFIRQFGKRLELRIETAIGILEEVIPKNHDSYFKGIINTVIKNDDDCWIIDDAFHWSQNKVNAVFMTLDGEIYYNRKKLLKVLKDYMDLSDSPIQIIHGKDYNQL